MKDIYWIGNPEQTRLAIVPRPRGNDWLETDLLRLKNSGIDVLISMVTRDEQEELGLDREAQIAESVGLRFHSSPILDRGVPENPQAFRKFVDVLLTEVRGGRNLGAHC
jgi:protein-tyrosine phosphatase